MRALFLPVGLVLAIVVGVLIPADIRFSDLGIAGVSVQQLLVICIFAVSGYRIRRGDVHLGGYFLLALVAAVAVNLVLGPVSAVGAARLFRVEDGITIGLVAMACVPTTLSSGIVIARNAGGNALWALMLTVLLTFIGVFVIPFSLDICLNVGVAIRLPVWPLMRKMIDLVLLPILAGVGLRRLLKARHHAVLDDLPSAAVILIVWMSVSQNAASLHRFSLTALSSLAGASLFVHLILLAAGWGVGYVLRLDVPEAKALLFVAAQKTLPIAMTVLISLPSEQIPEATLGIATVACVVFHFSQIIVDSFLASWMAGNSSSQ